MVNFVWRGVGLKVSNAAEPDDGVKQNDFELSLRVQAIIRLHKQHRRVRQTREMPQRHTAEGIT